MADFAAYLALGAVVGFFAGLLGIGGGIIIVSTLALMFAAQGVSPEYVMHLAIGTSLAAIVPGSFASFRAHHRHGAVDWDIVRTMVPGLLAGVFAGSIASRYASNAFLKDWLENESLIDPQIVPLEDVVEVQRGFEEGATTGKVVFRI